MNDPIMQFFTFAHLPEQQFEPPEPRRAHPLVAVAVILALAAMSWLPFFGGCS